MIESDPSSGPRPGRSQDRTLRRTTITVAVVSVGLSGIFTYQAANAPVASSAGLNQAVAPAQPQVGRESDEDARPSSAGPPASAQGGQVVAVSGGS